MTNYDKIYKVLLKEGLSSDVLDSNLSKDDFIEDFIIKTYNDVSEVISRRSVLDWLATGDFDLCCNIRDKLRHNGKLLKITSNIKYNKDLK